MKHYLSTLLFIITMICPYKMTAQNFGDVLLGILNGVTENMTMEAIVKNPNLQSVDMKNFLAFIKAGHASYNQGKYGDAMSHYNEASKIVAGTSDTNLKKLYLNYGYKAQLAQWYQNAYTQYKLLNPSVPQTNTSVYSATSVVPSTNGTTTTTTTPKRKCTLCHGTGLKIKEFYSSGQRKWCSTCGREVGTGHMHVNCDLCHGTGEY